MANNVFKNIPSVNELLENPQLKTLVNKVSHNAVVSEVRTFLDTLRDDLRSTADEIQIPPPSELAGRIAKWIARGHRARLQPVINATGVLLHTGLGRAPLGRAALDHVVAVGAGYASVEIDLETGGRGQRIHAVEKLLCELTGAEAALVTNNNAAATLLALSALAQNGECIVSRGELIEIGGSYRLPDVMAASGAILREVGTTNKTRIGDYEQACNENTAALLRAHTSNYRVLGFTEAPTLSELVRLAHSKGIPFIDDIGSGALIDLSKYGIDDEPMAVDSINAGADIVLFSGDKLLGGPQCGIVVGKRKYVDLLLKNPMMRALRVDKMTLAALVATLQQYRDPDEALRHVPLLSLISTSSRNLQNRAERLAPQLAATEAVATAEAIPGKAQLGGGSVPMQDIPTWCIAITPQGRTVDQLAAAIRSGSPSVMGRVNRDRLLLDLRSVFPDQDQKLVEAFSNAAISHEGADENDQDAMQPEHQDNRPDVSPS